MKIEVNCFATLSNYTPKDNIVEIPKCSRIRDLIQLLGIDEKKVKVIFLNGKHAKLDHYLHQGDRIGIFPAVGGG